MTKRTLIFVRVLWIVATAALMAAWSEHAWVLLLLLPVVGPVLREVAPEKDLDERQRLLDYRASHYALMVSYLVLFLLFARSWWQFAQEPPVELWSLVVAPLLVRVTMSVAQGDGGRRMALLFGFVCGAVWLAFAIASHGWSPELAVGVAILVFTALGMRWPYLGGSLLVLAAAVATVVLLRRPGGPILVRAVMALALPAPLLLAGVGLIAERWREGGQPADEFHDVQPAPPAGQTHQ